MLDGTSFVPRVSIDEPRKDSRVSREQRRNEGWTTLVFLGLAVATAVAAAAARGWPLWRPQS